MGLKPALLTLLSAAALASPAAAETIRIASFDAELTRKGPGLLLRDMWRIASGQATDDELLLVSESEELEAAQPHGKQPH